MLTLARLIRAVTGLIAAVIVAAILLRVLDANPRNDVVSFMHDLGRAFVGPFEGLFTFDDRKLEMAVDWGLAALLWSVVGGYVAAMLARAGLARGEGRAARVR